MKKLFRIGLLLAGGWIVTSVVRAKGYAEGAQDVMKENNIDTFSKKLSNGNTITFNRKSE